MFFLVVKPSKIIFLIQNIYPKRRIESHSIMGTIVSPNKILLSCFKTQPYCKRVYKHLLSDNLMKLHTHPNLVVMV